MVIFTDGEDQGSQLKITEAIEAAQKADSICYVLLIADRGFYGFGGYSGDREMKKLAGETGGRVIEVGNKLDKLKQETDAGRLPSRDYDSRLARIIQELRERGLDADRAAATAALADALMRGIITAPVEAHLQTRLRLVA